MIKYPISVTLLACLLLGGCAPSQEPSTGSAGQESQINFALMLAGAIGVGGALNLNGYGCYCGLGNDVGVIPVDATDACCLTHDHAWMDAGAAAPGCNCSTENYTFTNNNGVITCTAGQNACATYCCEADKAFVQCVQADPPKPAHQSYDRSKCEPIECEVDEDCEGGTWCNFGRCVPYCGGGWDLLADQPCEPEPVPPQEPTPPQEEPVPAPHEPAEPAPAPQARLP